MRGVDKGSVSRIPVSYRVIRRNRPSYLVTVWKLKLGNGEDLSFTPDHQLGDFFVDLPF